MAINNPAGSNTPAVNTMSVHQPTSGARTRNVVNVANPGGSGDVAFSWAGGASADGAPTAATDGFANFRRQRYLHVLVKNNNTGGAFTVNVWLYNSAFEQWGRLGVVDPADGGSNPAIIPTANNGDEYVIFDIKGAERIYVAMTAIGSNNTAQAWCGVNSF